MATDEQSHLFQELFRTLLVGRVALPEERPRHVDPYRTVDGHVLAPVLVEHKRHRSPRVLPRLSWTEPHVEG